MHSHRPHHEQAMNRPHHHTTMSQVTPSGRPCKTSVCIEPNQWSAHMHKPTSHTPACTHEPRHEQSRKPYSQPVRSSSSKVGLYVHLEFAADASPALWSKSPPLSKASSHQAQPPSPAECVPWPCCALQGGRHSIQVGLHLACMHACIVHACMRAWQQIIDQTT